MKTLIQKAKSFAYSKDAPTPYYLQMSAEVGIRLAKELGANTEIVEAGVYFMDCMIADAIAEGRVQDHIQMSLEKANEFLGTSDISEDDKENMRQCVLQHHGIVGTNSDSRFHSLEAEIVCNADCYRWASVQGVLEGTRLFKDMEPNEFIKFAEKKIEEKWAVLSLDICIQELETHYKTLKKVIKLAKIQN